MRKLFFAVVSGALLLSTAGYSADAKIEKLWKAKCSSCHGLDGKGATKQGEKMGVKDYTKAEWQKSRTDAQLKDAIVKGVNKEEGGKKQEMDGYDKLKPEEIDGLIAFIRGLK
jgi:mono/diheme cytochrome c family protein